MEHWFCFLELWSNRIFSLRNVLFSQESCPGGIHMVYIMAKKDSLLTMFSASKIKEQVNFEVCTNNHDKTPWQAAVELLDLVTQRQHFLDFYWFRCSEVAWAERVHILFFQPLKTVNVAFNLTCFIAVVLQIHRVGPNFQVRSVSRISLF